MMLYLFIKISVMEDASAALSIEQEQSDGLCLQFGKTLKFWRSHQIVLVWLMCLESNGSDALSSVARWTFCVRLFWRVALIILSLRRAFRNTFSKLHPLRYFFSTLVSFLACAFDCPNVCWSFNVKNCSRGDHGVRFSLLRGVLRLNDSNSFMNVFDSLSLYLLSW